MRKDRERLEVLQELLVLADSSIRYLDETCEADKVRRMTYCLPGAGVQDMVERYKRVVEGTGKDALVVVHVGVNDVGRVSSEELLDRYRELLWETSRVVGAVYYQGCSLDRGLEAGGSHMSLSSTRV